MKRAGLAAAQGDPWGHPLKPPQSPWRHAVMHSRLQRLIVAGVCPFLNHRLAATLPFYPQSGLFSSTC